MKINGYAEKYGSVDKNEVLKFEEEIGFNLPNDYKEFLINYNGGRPEGECAIFTIEGIDQKTIEEMNEGTGLEELFGLSLLEKIGRGVDLRYWLKDCKDEIKEKCIVIGSGFFGLIVLSENPEMKGIYLWDNQWNLLPDIEDYDPAEDEEMEFCVYKISDTFTEFIDNLIPYVED